ncbi:MAG: hypothetical protein R3D28_19440 [Geminicoccaceae bacterium]
MRIALLFVALPLALSLVALAQQPAPATRRVVVVDSLPAIIAERVVPALEAELASLLARDGQRLRLATLRGSLGPELATQQLASSDLVISLGRAAAASAARALAGTTTPHLFAFVPPTTAARLVSTDGSPARGRATGIAGRLSRVVALAMLRQLLAGREAAPLRVGVVHLAEPHASDDAARLVARAPGSLELVPIRVATAPDATTGMIIEAVRAAIADASNTGGFAGFWLTIEPPVDVPALVRAINGGTGGPVLYAPGLDAVAAGALMSIVPEPDSMARDVAAMAKRLLDGREPAALPVQSPSQVDFALNLKTADLLGIVPSPELLELTHGRLYR